MAESPVPVVCGIIERNGLFLAAQRAANESNALLWEFPGGKIKKRESPRAALARELREELGVEVSITRQLSPSAWTYPRITIELIPFVCSLVAGEPRAREHASLRWITAAEAGGLPWAAADVPVLNEYLGCRPQE